MNVITKLYPRIGEFSHLGADSRLSLDDYLVALIHLLVSNLGASLVFVEELCLDVAQVVLFRISLSVYLR